MFELLYQHRVEAVLSGDSHNYERFAPQTPGGRLSSRGVRQFIAGTGGKNMNQFRTAAPNSEWRIADSFGVLVLRLHARSYTWQFLAHPGVVRDSGRGVCH